MGVKLLHIADTHLGYKQYGFEQRKHDFESAFASVMQKAEELKPDAVIIAGDIFHTQYPSGSTVNFVRKLVKKASMPVLGIEGNHDLADVPNSWLDNCGITPLDDPIPFVLHGSDGTEISIAGINYCRTPVLLERLKRLAEAHDVIDVCVLHCAVAEMCGFGGVDLTADAIAETLAPVGTRAVLLGDIHNNAQVFMHNMWLTYSGSLEMTASDDRPDKVANLIHISDTGETKIELISVPNRPIVRVHISEESDVDGLLATVAAAGNNPLALITYVRAIPNIKQRLKELLEGKCMYRLLPAEDAGTDLNTLLTTQDREFSRSGALSNLRTVITQDFGYEETDDRFGLITAMMDNPGRAADICMEYTASKGINLIKAVA